MNISKFSRIAFPALGFAAVVASCSSDPEFSISGKIENAADKTLLLERPDHAGIWNAIDSIHLKDNGKFSFKSIAPDSPEIYRLALDGQYIYFPVDSIEHLSLNADARTFATSYSIEGSENAVTLSSFEKELLDYAPKLSIADSAASFKRKVYTKYLQDARGSVVSYYILTKTVNDSPLFSTEEDGKYFAAVATSFKQFRPDDPRTALLEQTATQLRRQRLSANGKRTLIEAQEVSLFPINLPDEKGNNKALSDIVGNGTPTALIITDFTDPDTPAFNIELKKLYDAGNLKVYNVGIDSDQIDWRNAASNLPWTTVFATPTQINDIAADYRFTELPAIYLIDRQGNLTSRHADLSALKKSL